MSDKKIRTMVTAAVLAALSCVATMVVQIPSPMNGYVNLGDCFVLLSGWLLGPWWGAAAGGIGSMLADLLLGYGHYAPGTLIIKGAMALVAALVFKAFRKNTAGALIGGVAAEVVMVAGYFGYAALLLGKGIGAAASVPGNLVHRVKSIEMRMNSRVFPLIFAGNTDSAVNRRTGYSHYVELVFHRPERFVRKQALAGFLRILIE